MIISDLEKIKKDFDEVIKNSQGILNPKTDKLFNDWFQNKKEFIEAFGDSCIYEFPETVSFELDPLEKHQRVMNFVHSIKPKWKELADFIVSQEIGFFNNISVSDYLTKKGRKIKKGAKLIKSFKYFVDGNNPKDLEVLQNKASEVIQENSITGKLCLSVHPLDFLSLSENAHNWSTCHSLHGSYRAGNLSYMVDKHTFICYLKSERDFPILGKCPVDNWNSKKWRMLLFLSADKNMIIAGRQYPFSSKSGLKIVLKDLLPRVNFSNLKTWSDWKELSEERFVIRIDNKNIYLQDLYHEAVDSHHYDDIKYSTSYSRPIYTYKYKDSLTNVKIPTISIENTRFVIGKEIECLECGAECCYEDTMRCLPCELDLGTEINGTFVFCRECGERILAEEGTFSENGVYCNNCAENLSVTCDNCGEPCHDFNEMLFKDDYYFFCKECYAVITADIEEEF